MVDEQRVIDLELKVSKLSKELIDVKKIVEILAGPESVLEMLNRTEDKTSFFSLSTLKWLIAISLILFAAYQVYLKYYNKDKEFAMQENYENKECEDGVCTFKGHIENKKTVSFDKNTENNINKEDTEEFDYS